MSGGSKDSCTLLVICTVDFGQSQVSIGGGIGDYHPSQLQGLCRTWHRSTSPCFHYASTAPTVSILLRHVLWVGVCAHMHWGVHLITDAFAQLDLHLGETLKFPFVNWGLLTASNSWPPWSIVLFDSGGWRLIDFCTCHAFDHVLCIGQSTFMFLSASLLGPLRFLDGVSRTFWSWTWRFMLIMVYRHLRLSPFLGPGHGRYDSSIIPPVGLSDNLSSSQIFRFVYRLFSSSVITHRVAPTSCNSFWKFSDSFGQFGSGFGRISSKLAPLRPDMSLLRFCFGLNTYIVHRNLLLVFFFSFAFCVPLHLSLVCLPHLYLLSLISWFFADFLSQNVSDYASCQVWPRVTAKRKSSVVLTNLDHKIFALLTFIGA